MKNAGHRVFVDGQPKQKIVVELFGFEKVVVASARRHEGEHDFLIVHGDTISEALHNLVEAFDGQYNPGAYDDFAPRGIMGECLSCGFYFPETHAKECSHHRDNKAKVTEQFGG